ncbi:E3 ubiquitin-protein ligase HERC2 [Culicoides brevitarsis]|uniref:E3 ubiquitin-protein ligase HERC2 n=1 Tax=Culicoides brevitarsis TaxID=469753 RepID=UPI00307B6502
MTFEFTKTREMIPELPDVYFLGQNHFGQFKKSIKDEKFYEKIDWSQFSENPFSNILNFDIAVTVNYSAIAVDSKLFISTIDLKENVISDEKPLLTKTFSFDSLISKVSANTSYCLILLENGDLFQIMIGTFEKRQISCLNVEVTPEKKSIFVENRNSVRNLEKIVDIACGETVCVAVTNLNAVYNIPNLTFNFPKHTKIRKICCGNEHSMILTANGDVFTWGTGLRGQLGHGEIQNEEVPKLVEGLAGLKVVDISAGGWSSAAITSFGDLYMWGWNSHGQLGFRVFDVSSPSTQNPSKNQTVYTIPTLVSLDDEESDEPSLEISCKKVFCGSKHTLVLTEDGKLFVTGSNVYKQLGLEENFKPNSLKKDQFLDNFTELQPKLPKNVKNYKISCAYSCTLFIENK